MYQWIEDELLYPGIYQASGIVVRCSCCKAVSTRQTRPCNSYSVQLNLTLDICLDRAIHPLSIGAHYSYHDGNFDIHVYHGNPLPHSNQTFCLKLFYLWAMAFWNLSRFLVITCYYHSNHFLNPIFLGSKSGCHGNVLCVCVCVHVCVC